MFCTASLHVSSILAQFIQHAHEAAAAECDCIKGIEFMPGRADTHWMTGQAEQGNSWRSQCRHDHVRPEALLLALVGWLHPVKIGK